MRTLSFWDNDWLNAYWALYAKNVIILCIIIDAAKICSKGPYFKSAKASVDDTKPLGGTKNYFQIINLITMLSKIKQH